MNVLKIVRLIIQIMWIVYLVGNFWFILVLFQSDLLVRQRNNQILDVNFDLILEG